MLKSHLGRAMTFSGYNSSSQVDMSLRTGLLIPRKVSLTTAGHLDMPSQAALSHA